jgi:hypothetical protein
MLARLPYRIYREWIAYAAVEPFGEERADLRAAIVSATMANSIQTLIYSLARKHRKANFKPKDFMPEFEPPHPKTPDELFEHVLFLNWLYGGTYIDKRESHGKYH